MYRFMLVLVNASRKFGMPLGLLIIELKYFVTHLIRSTADLEDSRSADEVGDGDMYTFFPTRSITR